MKRFFCILLAFLLLWGAAAMGEEKPWQEKEVIPDTLELIPISDALSQVRFMRRIVNNCDAFPTSAMEERVYNYNAIFDSLQPHIPVYLYLAESSRSHPMEFSFDEDSNAYIYLMDNLHADGMEHLKFDTFEQFCQYYYTTDHHWNYRGSYQAYVDIVKMLKGPEEEVLKPSGEVTFPVYFHGSFCRDTKLQFSQEYFTVYDFDPFPSYTAYINGKKRDYDHFANYLTGTINTKPLVNHYALYYGGDYGFIVFENTETAAEPEQAAEETGIAQETADVAAAAQPEGKGTLLIFGNSLSNAVKTMLIHHYDRIVYVDLRHYNTSRGMGKPFSMHELLEEYPVDQILLLGDVNLFMDGELMNP